MPESSPYQIDIPETDIATWLFPRDSVPSEKPIWIDSEDTRCWLSPKTLLAWAKRFAVGLQQLGLRDDDVVLVHATNHIFVPVVFLGAIAAGCIFSGCNPIYSVSEVKFQINNTGAKVMLVDPALLETALQAADLAGLPRERVFLFNDVYVPPRLGLYDWSRMLGAMEEANRWQWRELSANEHKWKAAVLNYSSGTTGLPKGVVITHQNVIANVTQSLYMRRLRTEDAASLVPQDEMPQERWLGFLPLYHAYGQLWSISAAAKSLTPVFFMRRFDYRNWLQQVQDHRITHIQTAPPLCVMLAKRPETKEYDLRSLKNILCGAAPLSAELQNEMMSKIGRNLQVVQTMGMTELTCSTVHVPGLMKDLSGSVGLADPNCTIKLVDDNDCEVADGERGELLVKGPNVCAGYWHNQEATRNAFDPDGFLRSGDIAIRKKGWYWIVDRKKELIKVKGFQVAPAELEAVLLENDDVADVAVVGLQGDHEEQPRAYIVLKDHAKGKTQEKEIAKWLAGRVAKHKQLAGGVKFVNEVPKSASGKIQRVVMRKWAMDDLKEMHGDMKAKL